jgi:hypothetical protein
MGHGRLIAAEPVVPESAKQLMGCWQNTSDDAVCVRFAPAKVSWLKNGKPQFALAKYEPGKVRLTMGGERSTWKVEIKGEMLTIDQGIAPAVFKKIVEAPGELDVKAAPVAEAMIISPEKTREIQDEIAKRQALAESTRANPEQFGNVASDNAWWLKKTIREYGWIDTKHFGKESAGAAFRLTHASVDLPLMLAALPGLEKEAKARQIDAQHFAVIFDRARLQMGERQLHGTQIGRDNGGLLMLPMEPLSAVDAARKALGLPPFADYIETYEKHSGKKIKVEE